MSYEELIKEGDRIEVWWSNDEYPTEPGIVLYKPNEVGELWEIKFDDGDVMAINPRSTYLAGFRRAPKKDA